MKTSSYNDQVTNENKIKKLSFVNDSLVTAINKKDTLIDSLRVANVSFKKDKEKEKAKLIYAKKASTLTRDQEYDKKAQFIYNFGTYIEWPVEY
ncbi:MAG: hypothetical protein ACXVP4_11825, partial [Bacteroidia bacterium]